MTSYTVVRGNSDSTGTVTNLPGPSKIQHLKVIVDDLTTSNKERKNKKCTHILHTDIVRYMINDKRAFGAGIKCLVYCAAYLQFNLLPLPFGSDCSGSWVLLESYCVLSVVNF